MNVVMKAKDEDADRDRFVELLKKTDGIEYLTIAVDVPTKSGQKDFDYLLRESSGKTMALEVTWLSDRDESGNRYDFVAASKRFSQLLRILESLISDQELPCGIRIEVPYHVPLTMKQMKSLGEKKLALIKMQLMAVIQDLSAGRSVSVDTEIGSFQIYGVPGSGLILHSVGGHRGGIFDEDYFAAKVRDLIPRKNQQLDYDSDRRVLLIGNAIGMTFESKITRLAIIAAIKNFIQGSPQHVTNIDEVYVDFGISKIERIY
jgi:hypothetical protein